jgi:hypothetical protein
MWNYPTFVVSGTLFYMCSILNSFSNKYLRWQNTKVVLLRKSNIGTMLLWKVCLSIGFWMPTNICLHKYYIPLLNDQSFLYWRKLCRWDWRETSVSISNMCQSLSWSSKNMCTTVTVTWYCFTSSEFMILINLHLIDNNWTYVLIFYLLNCLFNGFKIIITTFQ